MYLLYNSSCHTPSRLDKIIITPPWHWFLFGATFHQQNLCLFEIRGVPTLSFQGALNTGSKIIFLEFFTWWYSVGHPFSSENSMWPRSGHRVNSLVGPPRDGVNKTCSYGFFLEINTNLFIFFARKPYNIKGRSLQKGAQQRSKLHSSPSATQRRRHGAGRAGGTPPPLLPSSLGSEDVP